MYIASKSTALVLTLIVTIFIPFIATASDDEFIEVTTWKLTLPDGRTIKYHAVEGQDAAAKFRYAGYPHWITFKPKGIDHAADAASFELFRTDEEKTRTPRKLTVSHSLESFEKADVSIDDGFDVRVEITEIRKIRTSEIANGRACSVKPLSGGGGNCCVSCGGTEACGCGVCMDCGSCCNQGCFCPPCD